MLPRLSSLSRGSSRPADTGSSFWTSAGGAALITVLIGGVFSTLITAMIQRGTAQREFENEMVKAFGQYKLELLKTQVTAERAAKINAQQLVGRTMTNGQSLIDIAGPAFAQRADPAEEELNQTQQQAVRTAFNAARDEWEVAKVSTASQLVHYYTNSAAGWAQLASEVDGFLKCAADTDESNWSETRCHREQRRVQSHARTLWNQLQPRTHEWLNDGEVAAVRRILRAGAACR